MTSPVGRVSVLLATRHRPHLLTIALNCFARQSLRGQELLLLADADDDVPAPLPRGVRVLRFPPGTPLGRKLNQGAASARGRFLAKWDDDDYYACDYLARMCGHLEDAPRDAVVTFLQPFLLYDARTDRLLLSDEDRCSGATLFLRQRAWLDVPFRDAPAQIDSDLLLDVLSTRGPEGVAPPSPALRTFVQLRHVGHLWDHMPDGQPVADWLSGLQPYPADLSDIVDARTAETWRRLHRELRT